MGVGVVKEDEEFLDKVGSLAGVIEEAARAIGMLAVGFAEREEHENVFTFVTQNPVQGLGFPVRAEREPFPRIVVYLSGVCPVDSEGNNLLPTLGPIEKEHLLVSRYAGVSLQETLGAKTPIYPHWRCYGCSVEEVVGSSIHLSVPGVALGANLLGCSATRAITFMLGHELAHLSGVEDELEANTKGVELVEVIDWKEGRKEVKKEILEGIEKYITCVKSDWGPLCADMDEMWPPELLDKVIASYQGDRQVVLSR